jgi:hypothetical protein
MKAMFLCVALLLAASAANGQTVDSSVVCAVHKLAAMGYTIESANKDFGLVKATKTQEGSFVTTINVAQQDLGKLKVTVKLTHEVEAQRGASGREYGEHQVQDLGEGTKYTKADAQAIRDACSSK